MDVVRDIISLNHMKKTRKISIPVIFTPAIEGGYTATVPNLPGCISEGDSFEKAKKNIAEAIELYLSVKKKSLKNQTDFVIAPVSVSI